MPQKSLVPQKLSHSTPTRTSRYASAPQLRTEPMSRSYTALKRPQEYETRRHATSGEWDAMRARGFVFGGRQSQLPTPARTLAKDIQLYPIIQDQCTPPPRISSLPSRRVAPPRIPTPSAIPTRLPLVPKSYNIPPPVASAKMQRQETEESVYSQMSAAEVWVRDQARFTPTKRAPGYIDTRPSRLPRRKCSDPVNQNLWQELEDQLGQAIITPPLESPIAKDGMLSKENLERFLRELDNERPAKIMRLPRPGEQSRLPRAINYGPRLAGIAI